MKSTSLCPFNHYERANAIYEKLYGISSPKFFESLRKIADSKLRKYNYVDNIEMYTVDTRNFSEVPDVSISVSDKEGVNFEEAGSFYKYIENEVAKNYQNNGEFETKYSLLIKILCYMAYCQIYILRNGKMSRPKIAILSKQINEIFIKMYGENSIFCLNPFLGVVCSFVRNKEIQEAEIYSVKMIEIIEEYINSMGNQYSLIANIHISVMYFIMKQTERANSLFTEILQQELEYVNNDKSHQFLEQIYLHLALMYQSLKQYNSALVMWKCLLRVHRKQFSFNLSSSHSNRSEKSTSTEKLAECYNNYISTDYYNIGKCYLQLNDKQKALFNLEMSLKTSEIFIQSLTELQGQECQYPHSYFEDEINRVKMKEVETMKSTQASIEEIKNPKVANITPVKVQPPKTDAANKPSIKKSKLEEEKIKKETGLSIITEESMSQSLLQTKFESIRKLGVDRPRLQLQANQLKSETNIQKSGCDSSSSTNKLEYQNLGFLMTMLSSGLGVWYLPKSK